MQNAEYAKGWGEDSYNEEIVVHYTSGEYSLSQIMPLKKDGNPWTFNELRRQVFTRYSDYSSINKMDEFYSKDRKMLAPKNAILNQLFYDGYQPEIMDFLIKQNLLKFVDGLEEKKIPKIFNTKIDNARYITLDGNEICVLMHEMDKGKNAGSFYCFRFLKY